ncbi:hypothetical protein ACRAWG_32415 [Methylobacterium sp. P31]
MTDKATPPTTRWLLERIAATLNLAPAHFFQIERPPGEDSGPSALQCDEVVSLFRAIKSPVRRDAVLNLLREMARDR